MRHIAALFALAAAVLVLPSSWEKQGATPITMTQAEFTAFMAVEVAKWAKVIKANHIALIE